jgi:hypothetical protein
VKGRHGMTGAHVLLKREQADAALRRPADEDGLGECVAGAPRDGTGRHGVHLAQGR